MNTNNHSYSDVQLYAIKSFRALLRKLDTLQSDQFYRLEKYVKPPKSFVRDGAASMDVQYIHDYYMRDDGLELAVKHQILSDTIEDWVALELYKNADYNCFNHNHSGSQLFDATQKCLDNLERYTHEERQKKEWIEKHAHYSKQLSEVGEYTVDVARFIRFASGEVANAAHKVCATLARVDAVQTQTQPNDIKVAPFGERVLSQRAENHDTGKTWEQR